jgi:signal transduction histidine kinase
LDGDSVPASGDPQGGFGLVALRERLAMIHGTLDIESAPGEGTAISATVPCDGAS